jgi:hypothetical protein
MVLTTESPYTLPLDSELRKRYTRKRYTNAGINGTP